MATTHIKVLRVNAWNYPSMSRKVRSSLVLTVRKHGLLLAKDIRANMRKRKTGNVYRYKGRVIRASAPGEAPAIRSGRLYRNVDPIFQNNGLQVTINPLAKGVKYAAWLELGTSKMEPRPYIKPAFARRRQLFLNDVRSNLAKTLAGG